MNPKDRIGAKKIGISHVPSVAVYHMAAALFDGVRKYGKFNWREGPVKASIYQDAADRHIRLWMDGEETASDSGVHHLGHAMACLAILLDAQEHNALVDDRIKSGAFALLLERLNDLAKSKAEPVSALPKQALIPEDGYCGPRDRWCDRSCETCPLKLPDVK